MVIVPDWMVSSRLIARHSVDLPEPDGPSTTTTSPRAMLRLICCSTCSSPKYLSTSVSTTSGGPTWSGAPGPGAGASALLGPTDSSMRPNLGDRSGVDEQDVALCPGCTRIVTCSLADSGTIFRAASRR